MQTAFIQILLLSALTYVVSSQRRALQEIRYHFTSCGKAGRNGPTYKECMEHYSSTKSRISRQNLIQESINSTPPVPVFNGAQIFSIPQFGLYNITVAGAAGARGICNTELGHGIARTIQLELDPNLKLLLLIGHRGLTYCDAEPFSSVCANKNESNFTSASCNKEWYTYLEALYPGQNITNYLGGGGGGGASMIRAYHNLLGFNMEPLVIGAGGGGTSAILDSTVVNRIGINNSSPHDFTYKSFIDAQSSSNNLFEFDTRVKSLNAVSSAGLGGSYHAGENNLRLAVDGGYLGQSAYFAISGLDCVRASMSNINSSDTANGSYGGFGGGGGGCAGGGGGGGYLGGSVLGTDETVPGSGGLSTTGRPFATTFKFIDFIGDHFNGDMDGYIDIVNADCECIFRCDVFTVDDEFECVCPGKTLLAPDGSDCYIEVSETVLEEPIQILPLNDDGIIFFYQQLKLKNQIYLYSIDFEVTVDPLREVDHTKPETVYERCILAFLGENYEAVAFTDVHRRSVQVLNTLEPVINEGRAEHVRFLDSPVLVYTVLIVSAGNCTINNMTLHLNVSIRDKSFDEFSVVDEGVVSEAIYEFLIISASNLIQSTSTPLIVNNQSTRISVGVGVAVSVLFIVIIVSILIGTSTLYFRNSRHRPNSQESDRLTRSSTKGSNLTESSNFPCINSNYINLTDTDKSAKFQTL